jgi:hypothetical protein
VEKLGRSPKKEVFLQMIGEVRPKIVKKNKK